MNDNDKRCTCWDEPGTLECPVCSNIVVPRISVLKIDCSAAGVPRICGTCRKREPESGYCFMWCRPTESTATCSYWMLEEDESQNEKVRD